VYISLVVAIVHSLESLWVDVRFALRQLRKSPGSASVCVLSLALGIGATTAIFSVVYCVVLEPLPYAGADRMVHIDVFDRSGDRGYALRSGEQFAELNRIKALDGAIAEDNWGMTITNEGLPQAVQADQLSANAFHFFGVPPLMGRGFTQSDASIGQDPAQVAILSFRFWKSHYSGRSEVIGKILQLDHKNYTIIGIVPKRFAWSGAGGFSASDVYLPLKLSNDQSLMYPITARLKPGVSRGTADVEIQAIFKQFVQETPDRFPPDSTVRVVGLKESAIGSVKGTLFILLGAVATLLAIGCINVGILLLARGVLRENEFAIRNALGARRIRLVRQLLTESLVIAVTGGVLGIPMAFLGTALLMKWIPQGMLPMEVTVSVSVPVLLFSMAVALATGIFCGLRPASDFSRPIASQALAGYTRGAIGNPRNKRMHMMFVVSQIALSVLLLAVALAAVRTFARLHQTKLGYNPRRVLVAGVSLAEGTYQGWSQRINYYDQLRGTITDLPGAQSVALAAYPLPPVSHYFSNFSILGRSDSAEQITTLEQVSRGYFSTLGIPLLQGRVWSDAEEMHAVHVALINEAMARRYWPNSDAIGQVVRIPNLTAKNAWVFNAPGNDGRVEIIGVVGNVPNAGLSGHVLPSVYAPYSLVAIDWLQLVVKTRTAPMAMVHQIREQVKSINATQALNPIGTAEERLIAAGWAKERFVASLFSILAVLALVLSAIGLYSVISYTVSQSSKEFGIRIALGATRGHILHRVALSSGIPVAMGLFVGIMSSMLLNNVVLHWTEASLASPLVLSAVCAILAAVSVLAAVPPALRAASVDPMQTLKSE
jgi:predicted permease